MFVDRRRMLQAGLAVAGLSLVGRPAAAAETHRSLSFVNLHTGEKLSATYWEAGDYIPEAMRALNRVLRDHRTGEVHPMSPDLLDLVASLRGRLGAPAPVEIISGYRSPASNATLHARSKGVATRSLHMQGQAIDLRIPGVELAGLRDAALALRGGGVGYYPQSRFVHVDVGRVRRWQGA